MDTQCNEVLTVLRVLERVEFRLAALLGLISTTSQVWSLIIPKESSFEGMSVDSFSWTAAGN